MLQIRFHNRLITISSREALHEYFNFKVIYRAVLEDSYQYKQTVRKFNPIIILDDDIVGGGSSPGILSFLNDPETFLGKQNQMEGRIVWAEKTGTGGIRINISSFLEVSRLYFQSALSDSIPDKINETECLRLVRDMKRKVQLAVEELTDKGQAVFSPEMVIRFALFFFLHMQAMVTDFAEEDVAFMKGELKGRNYSIGTVVRIPFENQELTLPFFQGSNQLPGHLDIVRIEYDASHDEGAGFSEKGVALQGTNIRRSVPKNGCVFALRTGGLYTGFLPRFSLSGAVGSLPQGKRLYHTSISQKSSFVNLSPSLGTPVSWSHSNEYGDFLIDDHGVLDESLLYRKLRFPNKKAVRVEAVGSDFAVLYADGSGEFGVRKHGWECLLDFALSVNNGIAINAGRSLLLEDGTQIASSGAVTCDCAEGHYIWTDAQGRAYTDSGLENVEDTTCLSAAVCAAGYLLGGKNVIRWYDFSNALVHQTTVKGEVRELRADGHMAAWFDSASGSIRYWPLEI